jgi:hypothetical protein
MLKGYIRFVQISYASPGTTVKPSPRKAWLILSGCVYHVTASASVMYITDPTLGAEFYFYWTKADTDGTGIANIFTAETGAIRASYSPIFICDGKVITLTGGAGCTAWLQVLEFDY